MLRISKKADYAVFLLGAIARQGAFPGGELQDGVVSAHEIARQAGLNKSVVANLLKQFAKSGMLESVRGLKGGYRLLRNPADISLEDILEVVEGRFELVDCVTARRDGGLKTGSAGKVSPLAQAPSMQPEDPHDCALIGFCPSKRPMRVVHERIAQMFREIRLDELCSLPTATGKTR
ncbi:MAG: Rrf2 family transcriptional regulator [Planctomycetes bacterium]|nr:Rrf2 family transcriptional regulator [Planctomycetota bacterium]MCC7397750.1 Rrf2 family transcriptional regulator [Planctomycetota bacterium]